MKDGVHLGIDSPMPRSDVLFSPKLKYPLDFSDACPHDFGGINSTAAEENADFVDAQLVRDVREGFHLCFETDADLLRLLGETDKFYQIWLGGC